MAASLRDASNPQGWDLLASRSDAATRQAILKIPNFYFFKLIKLPDMVPVPPDPFFNSKEGVMKRHNCQLPHWTQPGKIHFITFRLRDSLPIEVVKKIIEEKNRKVTVILEKKNDEVQIKNFQEIEDELENCHGECLLKMRAVRKIFVEAMGQYNHRAFEVLAYAIMPNHVHLLLLLLDGEELSHTIRNLKHYSSVQINKHLGRKGGLWQREGFDHIVRNPASFENLLAYVYQNPRNVPEGMYARYIRSDLRPMVEKYLSDTTI